MGSERTLPWDWYPGQIPANVEIADGAYVETSHSFFRYRSEEQIGASIGKGASMYKSSMLDVGIHGRVVLGDYAMLQGARIICDSSVTIGPYTMLSWLVLVMDSYRLPRDSEDRRRILRRLPATESRRPDEAASARPVHIGSNCWIGFGTCVLPGVTIGEAAIVGARSVVTHDVEPYTVVAGNPARFIRRVREEPSA